jgi:hypothetical protein
MRGDLCTPATLGGIELPEAGRDLLIGQGWVGARASTAARSTGCHLGSQDDVPMSVMS